MAPSGMRPWAASSAEILHRSTVTVRAPCAEVDHDRRSPRSRSSGISSAVQPPSAKWIGASRCVPPCSAAQKLLAAYHQPPGVWPCETGSS